MQTIFFFFIPLSQVSVKTKVVLCSSQATNVVGLGMSTVIQCKAEWGGLVIRLLIKGQKRTLLRMHVIYVCPRD